MAVGAALVTVNPPVSVPVVASVFVTTTSQAPAAAFVIGRLQVICESLTTDTAVALMVVWPVFLSATVAPVRNPVPLTVAPVTVALLTPDAGLTELTHGGAV